MKGVLLLGIVAVCVLPSLCRSTNCNKAVLDAITQLRLQLDELERVHLGILDSHHNITQYGNKNSSLPHKLCKLRKHKRRQKYGLHGAKITHKGENKVFIAVETPSTSESTTIDYTTETLEMIVSTDAGISTTELSGGFTDNPTTLSNLR